MDTVINCDFMQLKNEAYSSFVFIMDEAVYRNHQKRIDAWSGNSLKIFTVPGEEAKTLTWAQNCWEAMFQKGTDRKSCVVAIGGGAITDLAGFVSACYMRGIDWVTVPTTLLGMVDAGYGGKTAINLTSGKNSIGILHHPKKLILDPGFLTTLPEREFRSGIAEVIKYGIIKGDPFLNDLEELTEKILKRDEESLKSLILKCLEIKKEMIKENNRDLLNWGHTFAHAIEAITDYHVYLHGEAVSIGMHAAALASCILGYATKEEIVIRQKALLQRFSLPFHFPNLNEESLIHLMGKDKKSSYGKISLIVAEKIGKVFKLDQVESEIIRKTLAEAKKN